MNIEIRLHLRPWLDEMPRTISAHGRFRPLRPGWPTNQDTPIPLLPSVSESSAKMLLSRFATNHVVHVSVRVLLHTDPGKPDGPSFASHYTQCQSWLATRSKSNNSSNQNKTSSGPIVGFTYAAQYIHIIPFETGRACRFHGPCSLLTERHQCPLNYPFCLVHNSS